MPDLKFNIRALEMWEQISEHVVFRNKSVIDLGCGYGDLLVYAWQGGGAFSITGVDHDKDNLSICLEKFECFLDNPRYSLIKEDLDFWSPPSGEEFDIAICTSVLPYLMNPHWLLKWMSSNVDISIIECQYEGDGPGMISGDKHMHAWLSRYWGSVKEIGYTVVGYRNAKRTIWLCKNERRIDDLQKRQAV